MKSGLLKSSNSIFRFYQVVWFKAWSKKVLGEIYSAPATWCH